MLLILCSLILLIPALAGWGSLCEKTFKTVLLRGIAGKIITGIFVITLIWTALAFFIPLNHYLEALTVFIGVFYFFRAKLFSAFICIFKTNSFLLAFCLIIILFSSSFPPYILDHFGYYLPTVKWLTEYGLVKGIANLDLTLGQMSLWHIFQAGFSSFSDVFLRLNAALLFIYSLYIIEKKSWMHLCFIPVLLLFSQSPSPDLPVIVFSLIILNEILSGSRKISFIFAFSVFVFAIKPTMVWLPVLSLLYPIFNGKRNPRIFVPGFLVLIIYCIKNIWTFGYPVFPVSVIELPVFWRPNPEILNASSRYALMKTYDGQYTYSEIRKFSGFEYIKNWFLLDGLKAVVNTALIISMMVFTIFALIKKKIIISVIWVSLLIKTVLVLVFSAQYRFFTDVFFAVFLVLFYQNTGKRKPLYAFIILSIGFLSFITFPDILKKTVPSFRMSSFMGNFKTEQLYKPSEYSYFHYQTFKIGNLTFNISENYPFNFDTPLPAISAGYVFDYAEAGIFPQCIDEDNLKKGFIWKKLNFKEKNELKNVLHSLKSKE